MPFQCVCMENETFDGIILSFIMVQVIVTLERYLVRVGGFVNEHRDVNTVSGKGDFFSLIKRQTIRVI